MKFPFFKSIAALGAACLTTTCVVAGPVVEARNANIIFLGEQHDNPAHHAVQADWVKALDPHALVFEMLTPDQAMRVTDTLRTDKDALEAALQWETSGWPDFDMYYPIIAAAPDARLIGAAVPRDTLREAVRRDPGNGGSAHIATVFGLSEALPVGQQKTREALQRTAHCDALPENLLPGMVNVQRLRDATLAAAALDALRDDGAGAVVVITGNGHARADWGAAFLVRRAAPHARVFALGQGEDGSPPAGLFDLVLDAPGVDRGDPCETFR